ncbi:MAG: type IV pilin protein [bacterium]
MRNRKRYHLKGYTFPEITAVIIILSLAAFIAFPMYLNHSKKAKLSDTIMAIKTIAHFLLEKKIAGENIALYNNIEAIQDEIPVKEEYFSFDLTNIAQTYTITAIAKKSFGSDEADAQNTFSYTFYDPPNPKNVKFTDPDRLLEKYADYVLPKP